MVRYVAWTQDRNHNCTSEWGRNKFPRDLMPKRGKGPEKSTWFRCMYIRRLDKPYYWKYLWKNGKVVKTTIKKLPPLV